MFFGNQLPQKIEFIYIHMRNLAANRLGSRIMKIDNFVNSVSIFQSYVALDCNLI